jgi:hypothetical protein
MNNNAVRNAAIKYLEQRDEVDRLKKLLEAAKTTQNILGIELQSFLNDEHFLVEYKNTGHLFTLDIDEYTGVIKVETINVIK